MSQVKVRQSTKVLLDVKPEALKPGERLMQAIIVNGRVMIPPGTRLDDRHISKIREWRIPKVKIMGFVATEDTVINLGNHDGVAESQAVEQKTRIRKDGDTTIVDGDLEQAINVVGNLKILGNIKSGVKARASGDVLILGNIEGGHVTSEAGEITVFGDAIGSGRFNAMIECQKSIQLRKANNAVLICHRGPVRVKESIEATRVRSYGLVQVGHIDPETQKPAGRVVKSKIVCGDLVLLAECGSIGHEPVEIQYDNMKLKAMSETLMSVQKSQQELDHAIEFFRKELDVFGQISENLADLGPDDLQRVSTLESKLNNLIGNKLKLDQTADRLIKAIERMHAETDDRTDKTPKIFIWGVAYPGLAVTIDGKTLKVGNQERHPGFFQGAVLSFTSQWDTPFPTNEVFKV